MSKAAERAWRAGLSERRWTETERYLEGDLDAVPDEEILEYIELKFVEADQLGEDLDMGENCEGARWKPGCFCHRC